MLHIFILHILCILSLAQLFNVVTVVVESFTPDGAPLMGPNPQISGLFHAHGYNSGGMMLSGGSGLQLAQWVVKGQPELPMFSYDIRSV